MQGKITVEEGKLILELPIPNKLLSLTQWPVSSGMPKELQIPLEHVASVSTEKVGMYLSLGGGGIPGAGKFGRYPYFNGEVYLLAFYNPDNCITVVLKNEPYNKIIMEVENKATSAKLINDAIDDRATSISKEGKAIETTTTSKSSINDSMASSLKTYAKLWRIALIGIILLIVAIFLFGTLIFPTFGSHNKPQPVPQGNINISGTVKLQTNLQPFQIEFQNSSNYFSKFPINDGNYTATLPNNQYYNVFIDFYGVEPAFSQQNSSYSCEAGSTYLTKSGVYNWICNSTSSIGLVPN